MLAVNGNAGSKATLVVIGAWARSSCAALATACALVLAAPMFEPAPAWAQDIMGIGRALLGGHGGGYYRERGYSRHSRRGSRHSRKSRDSDESANSNSKSSPSPSSSSSSASGSGSGSSSGSEAKAPSRPEPRGPDYTPSR